MRTPVSEEDSESLFCVVRGQGDDATIYLLGDGVLCARRGQSGYHSAGIRESLGEGVQVKASARDLRARGIPKGDIMDGVEALEDLEGSFVEDAMTSAGRVFSW